ncbi:FAD-dependent oxidoreductase [Rathayibacter toxicus]|uniref:FAD-dependent oxidoreductase n=1 Tax=Rathayibacter toxicus TaxID=145458 RepID=UPI000CE89270|nr:FAD-dependent oxidoreductase [Rathayibacter toxicus]PPI56633.1 hypothetical protein C5D35_01160 [Rathayibacter toxicus]QOD10338.1 FAD-dependent oxidoreductase [Rathayibacter toxicus]QWL29010.1 FAD-dependent oxidoreductase [Rathayibacter toxicus]
MSADIGTTSQRTTCVIVGGGPAGLVLGLLMARAGIEVTVLEKHADFLRDFRGDTVHPSTLRLLDDLGLFDRFERLPQSRIDRVMFPTASGSDAVLADFTRLPLRHRYIAMVPQWDLLDLLATAAVEEPTFTLQMECEVTGILRDGGRVTGVEYTTPTGSDHLLADLTVACDGRWSVISRAAGLPLREFPVGFDVWWYRVATTRHLGTALLPRLKNGYGTITIPREGYLQVATLGIKGTDERIRAAGIDAFRAQTAALLPELADDVISIASLNDVAHLDVRLSRLQRWHTKGVLCIGDAAHAMSPVGGIGINLAVQDAVATARLLAEPLRRGDLARPGSRRILARVQRRRRLPTIVLQGLQRVVHAHVIMPALLNENNFRLHRSISALLRRLPWLSVIPAFLIGVGPRPERAPDWARRSGDSRTV